MYKPKINLTLRDKDLTEAETLIREKHIELHKAFDNHG